MKRIAVGKEGQQLSEEKIMSAIDSLVISISADLKGVVNRYLASGAIDKERFVGSEVLLAKILLKAALKDESDAFVIPSEYEDEVENLLHF